MCSAAKWSARGCDLRGRWDITLHTSKLVCPQNCLLSLLTLIRNNLQKLALVARVGSLIPLFLTFPLVPPIALHFRSEIGVGCVLLFCGQIQRGRERD